MKRKLAAMLLTLCMLFSIFPVSAFADLAPYKVIIQAVIRDASGNWVSTNALPSKFFNGTTSGGSSGGSGSWQWTAQDGGYVLTGQFDSHANVWGNLKYPTSLWKYDSSELQFMGIGKNSYSTEVAYPDDVDSSYLFEKNTYPLGVASGTEWRTYIFEQKGSPTPTIPAPTPDDLDGLGEIVNIECTTIAAQHPVITSKVLGDKDTDYTITHAEDAATAIVTITNTSLYVAKYNETYTGHALDDVTEPDLTIDLVYENDAWKLDPNNNTATVYVKCDTQPTEPPLPGDDDLEKLLQEAIKVECTTNTTSHNPLVTGLLGAKNTDYEVTQTGNAATVTITKTDLYVSKYNEKYPGHTLGENSDLTIGLVYENGAWALDPSNNTATVYVKCTVTPTIPAPTPDDLSKLDNIVNIECTNNSSHETITSAVRGGKDKDYIITHEANSDTATVTILNTDPYVTSYNKQHPGHTLGTGSDLELELVYKNGAWELDPSNPATVYVTCPPIIITPADLITYKGGEEESGSSDVNVVDGEGKPMHNDGSLPEMGFYLQLSDELNQQLSGSNDAETQDLSKYITLSAKDQDGNELSWKLEKYGDGTSVASDDNGYFIYKIVPAESDSGTKLNVTFQDSTGKYVGTDSFTLSDSLSEEYSMKIYGNRVNADTLKATITIPGQSSFTVGVVGNEEPATLTVRHVNGNQNDVVTASYESVEDAANADEPSQDALNNAYMIRNDATRFVINESNVEVNGEDVSLLFDDISPTTHNYEQTLTSKAVAAAIKADSSLNGATLKTEAKYLNLVEAGNGNAWVTADSAVTVYWPYPEGTNKDTKFYLAHFENLDRDTGTDAMAAKLEAATANKMTIQKDEYGISFTTSSFSPYVLVWETPKGQPTPPDDGKDNNSNNSNNSNTAKANVVNNVSAPAAPATTMTAIPQTGDESQPLVWVTLVVVSGAALAGLAVYRKKRSDK